MSTKIYGASDDLVEIDGPECRDELDAYNGCLFVLSDGSIIKAKWCDKGNAHGWLWSFEVLKARSAFTSEPHPDNGSDDDAGYPGELLTFNADITWAFKVPSEGDIGDLLSDHDWKENRLDECCDALEIAKQKPGLAAAIKTAYAERMTRK